MSREGGRASQVELELAGWEGGQAAAGLNALRAGELGPDDQSSPWPNAGGSRWDAHDRWRSAVGRSGSGGRGGSGLSDMEGEERMDVDGTRARAAGSTSRSR